MFKIFEGVILRVYHRMFRVCKVVAQNIPQELSWFDSKRFAMVSGK